MRANPFEVSRPYAATMRLALGLALLPGLGTGVVLALVLGFGLPLALGWPQLAQAHGQVQALGFVLLFIAAVGLQLFPRFLGAPLQRPAQAGWGASAVTCALVARWLAQPLEPGAARTVTLTVAALALPVGAIVAGQAFHGLSRRSVQPRHGPAAAWRRFILVGGLALGAALVLYLWSGLRLAAGDALVERGLDEALIHLELAGFAACLVFAVASRLFGRFLLLRTHPTLETNLPLLAVGWGFGLALTCVGWLAAAAWVRWLGSTVELAVLLVWLWLIGLYHPPRRESGTPHVTNPTRRWVRLALAFLVVGVALDVGLFGREVLIGIPPGFTELSAARHAPRTGLSAAADGEHGGAPAADLLGGCAQAPAAAGAYG